MMSWEKDNAKIETLLCKSKLYVLYVLYILCINGWKHSNKNRPRTRVNPIFWYPKRVEKEGKMFFILNSLRKVTQIKKTTRFTIGREDRIVCFDKISSYIVKNAIKQCSRISHLPDSHMFQTHCRSESVGSLEHFTGIVLWAKNSTKGINKFFSGCDVSSNQG